MVAGLSSSLGLFAVVWVAFCTLASALVTDAMLRGDGVVSDSRSNRGMLDGTGRHAGE